MERLRLPLISLDYAPFQALSERRAASLTADEAASLRTFRAFRFAQARLADAVPAADPTAAWARNAAAVDRWISRNRRAPVENNRRLDSPESADENRLAMWVRYELRPRTKTHRCTFQRALLNTYSANPRRNTIRWHIILRLYRKFIVTNGRAPRYRSSSMHERRLAAWASKQRLNYGAEKLNPHRVWRLEALPIWSWGSGRNLSRPYIARLRLFPWNDEGGKGCNVDLSRAVIVEPVPDFPESDRRPFLFARPLAPP